MVVNVNIKWVFQIKRNSVFRVRLVSYEYRKVPGLDFNDSFAPVVNDMTFKILLADILVRNLNSKIADVEIPFLMGT
jgi:hypothetical protein